MLRDYLPANKRLACGFWNVRSLFPWANLIHWLHGVTLVTKCVCSKYPELFFFLLTFSLYLGFPSAVPGASAGKQGGRPSPA